MPRGVDQLWSNYNQEEVKKDLSYLTDNEWLSELLNPETKAIESHYNEILSSFDAEDISRIIDTIFKNPDGKRRSYAQIKSHPSHDLVTQICCDYLGYHWTKIDSDLQWWSERSVKQLQIDYNKMFHENILQDGDPWSQFFQAVLDMISKTLPNIDSNNWEKEDTQWKINNTGTNEKKEDWFHTYQKDINYINWLIWSDPSKHNKLLIDEWWYPTWSLKTWKRRTKVWQMYLWARNESKKYLKEKYDIVISNRPWINFKEQIYASAVYLKIKYDKSWSWREARALYHVGNKPTDIQAKRYSRYNPVIVCKAYKRIDISIYNTLHEIRAQKWKWKPWRRSKSEWKWIWWSLKRNNRNTQIQSLWSEWKWLTWNQYFQWAIDYYA